MKVFSHGVSSCICVEANVIDVDKILIIYRLRALGSNPNYTPK